MRDFLGLIVLFLLALLGAAACLSGVVVLP